MEVIDHDWVMLFTDVSVLLFLACAWLHVFSGVMSLFDCFCFLIFVLGSMAKECWLTYVILSRNTNDNT